MSEIIEFGKYKGQPIQVLANDQEYTSWLASQPWLKDRYPVVYNVIINNFSDPEETPEHNRLQAKFLDKEFVDAIGRQLSPLVIAKANKKGFRRNEGYNYHFAISPTRNIAYQKTASVKFEVDAIDVMFEVSATYEYDVAKTESSSGVVLETSTVKDYESILFRTELKPIVGDDYPAILREMVHKRCNLLIYENFSSQAINEDQLKKFFATRKIEILSLKNFYQKNLLEEI